MIKLNGVRPKIEKTVSYVRDLNVTVHALFKNSKQQGQIRNTISGLHFV